MVVLFNTTLDIGTVLNATTSNVTGSMTMTFFLVVVFLLLVALLFKEPLVLFMVLILPLIIVFAVSGGLGNMFYTILTIIGIVLAWQFAKILMGWGR